ncbi:membrane protein insertase YidC [Rhizosaccharibacter radicis]|uniref:Membrane protein insertase YidC n=1 Tax=Rhizosaccharibacter radicis TaxID=2782605 RepID=A0ABT1VY20_9PROT|nr:membrane protein insertase YidC [Acetobacteraceae bacterium KSS12]
MDNKRFFIAVLLSAAILVGFEWLMPKQNRQQVQHHAQQSTQATPPGAAPRPGIDPAGPGTQPAAIAPPASHTRLPLQGARVSGSIDLTGARFDDLILRDYRETVKADSPQVRVLEPQNEKQPNYVQLGWSGAGGDGVKLPDSGTVWTADQPKLTEGHPVTLSWDNGAGLQFQIVASIDANFMFTVEQRVRNTSGKPVALFPWARVSRGYTPEVTGGYLVHEGPVGVVGGQLEEMSYSSLRTKSDENNGVGWSKSDKGGWAGITDKYWLTALLPDQNEAATASYRYQRDEGAGTYQVDFIAQNPQQVADGATGSVTSHVFAGAKEVHLLEGYEKSLHVADFWKAVDFGWFAFLTKPIFYVLDWLNTALGNFGLALMAFTLIVKTLFFPLATKQFRSMGKMKLLAPKMQALRERHKDDPMGMNQEMMALYRAEGVNPASGCLPMLVQIPVFWCLYKDLVITIEMRHAPFFGWIRDLSAPDPTNLFNLFGLLPFDPTVLTPMLHLGVWPLILGVTMFLMQKLNPPPADPAQQRIFQLMPLIFMFVLARQPAGLVIYYSWNNLLTMAQQWLIQRNARLGGGSRAVAATPR